MSYSGGCRRPRDHVDRERDEDGVQCLQKDDDNSTDNKDKDSGGAMIVQHNDKREVKQKKVNSKGESHCYHCGKEGDHWASECPELSNMQRAGLCLMDGAMISQVKQDTDQVKTGGV